MIKFQKYYETIDQHPDRVYLDTNRNSVIDIGLENNWAIRHVFKCGGTSLTLNFGNMLKQT